MSTAVTYARIAARWLARLEIIVLSAIFFYFIVSDTVPPAAFGLVVLTWLARWWTSGMLTRTTPFDLPILILLVWLPVSFSISIDVWQSLPKTYGVILSALFFYAVVNHSSTRQDLAWAVFWLVLACIAISFAGVVGTDWAQGKIVSATFIYDRLPRFVQGIPRSIAGGFARNGVGGTLTLIIPLLAALLFAPASLFPVIARSEATTPSLRECRGRLPRSLRSWLMSFAHNDAIAIWFPRIVASALVFAVITLALTQSRGAIFGTVVGLLTVAIWRERRFVWLLLVCALALFVLIGLGYGGALTDFVLRMDAQGGTLASRWEVWQRGLMMVQDFPYTGIGIGTYNQMAHLFYPFFIAAPDEVVVHAHNNLLQVGVDVGIPGLIAFVALLTAFIVGAIRAYGMADAGVRALIVGLVCGMLAHQVFGLTDAFILGTKPGVLMWVYVALVAVVETRSAEWQGVVG